MWLTSSLTISHALYDHTSSEIEKKKSLVLSETPPFQKKKNIYRNYRYLVLGQELTYLVKEQSDSKNMYSDDDIKMLEVFVDDICVIFVRQSFEQTVSIPMRTIFAPHLAEIFLYSYEAEFIQFCSHREKKQSTSRSISLTGTPIMYCRPSCRIWKLSGPDVFCWTWDHGHHREYSLLLLT